MTDTATVPETSLTINARDGYSLAATHFAPPEDVRRREVVIIISCATATPQKFYFHCARFFASRGCDVYTWDYRGVGKSAPPSLKGFDANVVSLAEQDMPAVLDHVHAAHPGHRLCWIGHSVGGQLLGLVENASLLDRAVTCSSQNGYWKMQGGNQKRFVWFTMYLAMPLLSHLCGYFPWKRFAGGEDLPKPAALQWARWCRSRNYLFDDASVPHRDRYDQLSLPILAYCFSDDDWGTREAVHDLMGHYTAADVEYRHVTPEQFGREEIGHFGYFRRGSEALWQDTLSWLAPE